ncbi:hypothetical protein PM10SUCC1_29080 [Propionigenium maris DSM 9537]|uniref:chitinase n=1 Tax=Propionigenium maris DSM 9537 TaxID=1123000 RepID=A0A9W6LNX7_9FUSO|nr:glycosyl hydrolase family 18 protein [Propionigenium maris]GLI57394.1 hypothetical protein PM10SUCC1_29080 [Propionigenium maris DSM 9537]
MATNNYNEEFLKIKSTDEAKLREIQERYNKIQNPALDLTEKVNKLKILVNDLEISDTLNYHLELKLLVQEIERILENEEEGLKKIPTVEGFDLVLKDGSLEGALLGVFDPDSAILEVRYSLFKDGSVVEEVIKNYPSEVVRFNENSVGSYYSKATVVYNLEDGTADKNIIVESNYVDIEEEVLPLEEPRVEGMMLEDKGSLSGSLIGVLDPEQAITSVVYKLKNRAGTVVETRAETHPRGSVAFDSYQGGEEYQCWAEYYYDLNDKKGEQFKVVVSNKVTINEVTEENFPEDLPHSNLWAYAKVVNNNVEVTLNNTWGIISDTYGVYVDEKLVKTGKVNHTSINKGSAENRVDISYYNRGDVKVVYKVTYERGDGPDKVVYYKSTTGNMAPSFEMGKEVCKYPEWNPNKEYGSWGNPENGGEKVYYKGKHYHHVGWVKKGEAPDRSQWGWREFYYAECPEDHVMDTLGSDANAHLQPMEVNKVVGLGTPMEKKFIAYTPEWGKWGGLNYTPKISPWDKITHMQYAFIDVRPDYTNGFNVDPDDDHSALKRANKDCPNFTGYPLVTPNFFDGSAAFSNYGSTNAFHTEYVEYSKKYPYVKTIPSLGGWSRSGFFRDAASDKNIAFFTERCVELIRRFGFMGIDIDWEYPGIKREGDKVDNHYDIGCPRATNDEGKMFTKLMKSLRKALDSAGEEDGKYYFLSCAISAGRQKIELSDVENWHAYCDYISYMTYDIHGAFSDRTNHHSYTHQNSMEPAQEYNSMSIEELLDYLEAYYGVPQHKINIGTPFYSRGWSNVRKPSSGWEIPSLPGLYTMVTATGTPEQGRAAPGTLDGGRGAGVLPISHINKLLRGENVNVVTLDPVVGPENPFRGTTLLGRNFKRYYDSEAKAPYLYSEQDGIFYTYEDEESLSYKLSYLKKKELGGVIAWDISMDDFGVNTIGDPSHYDRLEVEDHMLSEVIFDSFKSNARVVAQSNYNKKWLK